MYHTASLPQRSPRFFTEALYFEGVTTMRSACFLLLVIAFGLFSAPRISAQTTEFTYQGSLKSNGQAPTGNYDFEFRLYDSLNGGTQVGSVQTKTAVTVTDGIFSVRLDFGNNFPGTDRFLEISVRPANNGGFTLLTPRQKINSTPYAIQALNASFANTSINSTHLGGVGAEQYIVQTDPRLTDARNPLPNSGNYIQNSQLLQTPSNFNISGTGSANIFSAANRVNVGGKHGLSAPGLENIFAGDNAGAALTTGNFNAFFGSNAGVNNKSGSNNAFFGAYAGERNTTGQSNSFFGPYAGQLNTTGSENSFFGHRAGLGNSEGTKNSFFGTFAGNFNTSGSDNSFFGNSAGYTNSIGSLNAFFGSFAGNQNSTGSSNSFLGTFAGELNTTGSHNAFVGASAGHNNAVGSNNSFYGSNSGYNNTASQNAFFGTESGFLNTLGARNVFVGERAGRTNTTGELNTFVGSGAALANTTGSMNTVIGSNANLAAANLTYATAIGAEAIATTSNSITIGRPVDMVRVPGSMTVTGNLYATGLSVPASNITGVLNTNQGGTGLSFSGNAGNFLRSNGSFWTSSPLLSTDIVSGSPFYIQNSTDQQAASNFNISGTGTVGGAFSANSINSATVYAIGGSAVLSRNGTNNIFTGVGAGSGTTGAGNSFFGTNAGLANVAGANNTFAGVTAGQANTSGSGNSFFGANTGGANTTGSNNTLLGASANLGAGNLTFATAIGAGAIVNANNSVVLGRAADVVSVPGNLNVAGNISGSFTVPASNITGILGISNGGTGLGAVGANGTFLKSNGTAWTPSLLAAGDIPSGSAHYIHNSTTQQALSNFNISGNGTIGGSLAVAGTITGNIPATNITGILGAANGGTGISAPGAATNFLRSTGGGGWTAAPFTVADVPSGSSHYIQNGVGQQALSNFNISGNGTIGGSLNVGGTITGSLNVSNITGILGASSGGTGISASGGSTHFLRGNGSGGWTSAVLVAADVPSGSANYIQNTTTQQALSNFNISGNGTIGGNLHVAGTITGGFNVPAGSITGILAAANGGTGVSGSGGATHFLKGNGSGGWTSSTLAAADIPSGSTNYIQNTTSQQALSNFNISGNGTIGGNLSVAGSITGSFSVSAGNITGTLGAANGGTGISAPGAATNFLRSNGTGGWTAAALSATDIPTGSANYIQNSASPQASSNFNVSGTGTVGGAFTANSVNSSTDYRIGGNRALMTTGTGNTVIGPSANTSGTISNATAVGANSVVSQSNSLVLGSVNGVNGATSNTSVGIGTTAPKASLEVAGGSILVGTAGQGVILKSPNGLVCKRLGIDDTGAMVLTPMACP
jgi:hypothetical protein